MSNNDRYRDANVNKKDIGFHQLYLVYNRTGYMPYTYLQDALRHYNSDMRELSLVGRNYKSIKGQIKSDDTVLHIRTPENRMYLMRKM